MSRKPRDATFGRWPNTLWVGRSGGAGRLFCYINTNGRVHLRLSELKKLHSWLGRLIAHIEANR